MRPILLSWLVVPIALQAQIVLNEVMFNPSGPESTDEFVEVVNLSEEAVDLSGWQIGDGSDWDDLSDTGEGFSLAPGQYGLILDPDYFVNSSTYDDLIPDACLIVTLDGPTFGSGGFSNSQPETLSLLDDTGTLMDQHTYSVETEAGYSEERVEEGASCEYGQWKMSRSQNGTPGGPNSVSFIPAEFEARTVIINEIMLDPPSGEPEWFEVFNRSLETINLSGWLFSDSDTTGPIVFCTEDRFVDPGVYAVISEDSSIQYAMEDVEHLYVPFRWSVLNNEEDVLYLYDPSGGVIDRVSYRGSWQSIQNTSLERISPERASGDSANWYSCTAPSGMTPGTANSVYAPSIPSESKISIRPDPFSPDGDGFEDVAGISYQLPAETAFIRLQIYDINGRLIRTLAGGAPSGSQGCVLWDGKDENGKKASIGVYIVYLSCLNAQKTVRSEARTTLVLAGQL